MHIPDVYEEVVEQVNCITLTSRNYCVICDPVESKAVGKCVGIINSGNNTVGKEKVGERTKSFLFETGRKT